MCPPQSDLSNKFSLLKTEEDTFFENNDLDTIFSEWSNLIGDKGREYIGNVTDQLDDRFGGRISSFERHASGFNARVSDLNSRYGKHLGGFSKHVDRFTEVTKKVDAKEACNLM